MRKFTKSLMALAMLCIAGVTNAKETVVYSLDYSEVAEFGFWHGDYPDGASVDVDGESLVITNTSTAGNNWDLQLWIGTPVPTAAGCDYKVKITYKTTKAGGVTVALGTWTSSVPKYGVGISVSEEWQTLNLDFNAFSSTAKDNFIMWQCRSIEGTIKIKSVEVIETSPDGPEASVVYGDLVDVTPTMYVKNNGSSETPVAVPDADGIYTITDVVEDALTWNCQFWIAGEYPLSTGQKFKVGFDYKASDAQSVPTQTHAATPGSYIVWHCIGDVSFTDEWQHFEQEVEIAADMNGWQSVCFNLHRGTQVDGDTYTGSNTTYYFKNITLQEPGIVGEAVGFTVPGLGWSTFSCNKNVDLADAAAYGASFNGSYIELTPATELPAGEAVIIEGAGKYSFPVIPSASVVAGNDLKVSDGSKVADGTIYALGNKDGVIGFYKVAEGETVPAGKAYMVIAVAAPEFIAFGGETTSISEKNIVKNNAEAIYFNLAGQRVAQPTKGLYIVNGNKVVIK